MMLTATFIKMIKEELREEYWQLLFVHPRMRVRFQCLALYRQSRKWVNRAMSLHIAHDHFSGLLGLVNKERWQEDRQSISTSSWGTNNPFSLLCNLALF